jgi:acyl dehydratase
MMLGFQTIAVGTQIPALTKTVTREQIAAYAEASGDHNPIHLDEAFARSVGLGGVIAHGLLNLAFLSQCLTDWVQDPGRLKGLSCRFSAPVRPGDTITFGGTVTAKDPTTRRLTCSLWATNQRGERVLTHGLAEAEFPEGA